MITDQNTLKNRLQKMIGFISLILFVFILLRSEDSHAISAISNSKTKISLNLIQQYKLPADLGIFQHLQASLDEKYDLYAITLSDKYHAKLYIQPTSSHSNAKFINELSHDENFMIGINGSYYLPNFDVLGLLVYQNKMQQPIKHSSILNGCIKIDQQGHCSIEEMNSHCVSAYAALQAGPLLINQGQLTRAMTNYKNLSKAFYKPRRRTILAQSSQGQLLILVTSEIGLPEIANILLNHVDSFGLKDIITAINLDGGGSTGLYVRLPERDFYYPEMRPVKTMIFFNI